MRLLNTVYQSENAIQKKAAHVFLSTGLYHSSFFGPLYLFGQHKLPRTAELIKYALRITTLMVFIQELNLGVTISNSLKKSKKMFTTGYMGYAIDYMLMSLTTFIFYMKTLV